MTARADALVLIGPMGAGKTSVGRRVAKALGMPFHDTDAAIVRAHGPIPALFEERGEAEFRRLERHAVIDALASGGVVALGGGAVLDSDTQRDLVAHRVVMLTVAPRVVAQRVAGSARPLLKGGDDIERWVEILRDRRPIYESLADVTFDTSSGPLSDIVDAIVVWAQHSDTTEDTP